MPGQSYKRTTAKVTIACQFVSLGTCLPIARYGLDGFPRTCLAHI